ncbi:MAG: hypothetical protein ACP5T4_01010 [Candidatus Micrarchaeia archaeon]
MKAQLATLEALLSFLLVLSVVSFCAKATNQFYKEEFENIQGLKAGSAIYDLSNVLQTQKAKQCIESKNESCIASLVQLFGKAYGINVSISAFGKIIGSANLKAACFIIQNESICIGAGD